MLQHHIPSFYTSEGNGKRGQAWGKTTQTQKESLSIPLKNTDDQPAVKEADPQVLTAWALMEHLLSPWPRFVQTRILISLDYSKRQIKAVKY